MQRHVSLPVLLSIFLSIAGSWFSTASAATPLTLDEVIDAVSQTHPGLEVARRKVEHADGKALAARGAFDPTLGVRSKWAPVGYYKTRQLDAVVRQATPVWGVGLEAGYRVGRGRFPVYYGDQQTLSGGEVRAALDIPVWRDGPIDRRRAKITQTKLRKSGARRSRDAAQLSIERDAARSYWTWVASGQSLRVARDLLVIAERRDAGLNEQAAAGAIERIKLVDNRRLVLDRMAKVVAAERKFQSASLKLSLFLRDQSERPVTAGEARVPDALPEPVRFELRSVDDAVDQAIRRRPDIAVLVAERGAAAVEVRLARNQRAPAVNIKTFVAKDLGDGPAVLAPTEWGVGVVVELPLPLRAARGEYRAAKALLGSVDARARGLRDKVGAEIRTAYVALRAADEIILLARQQLSTTEELAEAERDRFGEGASNLVIVNLRETAVADAANQEIEALADYQRAHADFLVSTGRSPAP